MFPIVSLFEIEFFQSWMQLNPSLSLSDDTGIEYRGTRAVLLPVQPLGPEILL